MRFLKRVLLVLFFTTVLAGVIYFIEPPKSWGQATYFQILIFFIPLLLFLMFAANLFLNNFSKSFALGLGVMMLLVLQALDRLSLLGGLLVALVTALMFRLIPESPLRKIKIPKLKLSNKAKKGKLSGFRRRR